MSRKHIVKIWIDDERPAPAPGWHACQTAWDAIALIGQLFDECAQWDISNIKCELYISFDHDLGHGAGSGALVAEALRWWAHCNELPKNLKLYWAVHSANPIGRENIKNIMSSSFASHELNKIN